MPYFMYVTLVEEDKILLFQMDPNSGALEKLGEVSAPGRPAPLAITPNRKHLYVGRRGANEISSFAVDQSNGSLSLLGTAPLEFDPCYLATDRQGRYLLSSYYEGAHAAVHPIDGNGVAGSPTIEWLETGKGAHSIQTDPSNQYAFVPHIDNRGGPNAIFQFKFDPASGHLTPNSPARVEQPKGAGPRHFCFHPNRDILYFSNEQGCSVTGYNFDRTNGTLSPFQTISTLPEGYQGQNSCAQIQITPNGKYLYAPNRGHDSMAGFAVDPNNGQLTSLGQTPTEPTPRVFSIDPQGKFLYSAGLGSGKLAAFAIDDSNGSLNRIETYDVGAGPMWVLITELSG